MTPFGTVVRNYRGKKEISIKTLSKAIGVTSTYLSALERGKRRKPSKKVIEGVIKYFKLTGSQASEVRQAALFSDTRPKIPSYAGPEIFVAVHQLIKRAQELTPSELAMLEIILSKNDIRSSKEEVH